MGRGPLVTRSELRKRQEAETTAKQREVKLAERSYKKEEKEISNFYRKEKNKNKPITKTRSGERNKQRQWNGFLTKATFIVVLLLIVVFLAIFLL